VFFKIDTCTPSFFRTLIMHPVCDRVRSPPAKIVVSWRVEREGKGGGGSLGDQTGKDLGNGGVAALSEERERLTCLLCKAPVAVARPFARLTGMSNSQRAQPLRNCHLKHNRQHVQDETSCGLELKRVRQISFV
jgi:hypothetical protein